MSMDVSAKRTQDGEYQLELGSVTLTLPENAIQALYDVIEQRLNQSPAKEVELLKNRVKTYRSLATKISEVDDRVVQRFAPQLSPEQLVTLVRLADGDAMKDKVIKNLSKSNRRQFEEDYAALDKITYKHACIYMEQLLPLIKLAAQEQKAMQGE